MIGTFKRWLNLGRTAGAEPQDVRIRYSPMSTAGVMVDSDSVLTVATVHACIRFLSQTLAMLPWEVKRPLKTASVTVARHPVGYLLSSEVSDEYTSFQFRETMLSWALRYGNGYAEIVRDTMGRISELCPLHPDRVDLYRDNTTRKLFYMVDGSIRLEPRDVFHLRGFGEGPKGLNVMKYAAESIGHARAMQLFGAAFFGSGANPSGIVEAKRPMSPEGIDELEARFKRIYSGPKRSNKTMVLDSEMTYRTLSTTPEAAQSVQSQQHMVAEICRWFGVPPHKVQHLLQATFSNIEHQSIEVVTDSVMPWVRRFCDEANRKLLGANRDGVFTHMDLTYLLRGDSTARVARYRGLREIGVLSVDEIRAEEGYAPLGASEGGEKRVMQSQYTTLEKIGEAPEPVAAVTSPAPGLPEQPPQDDKPTNIVYLHDPRFRDIEERLATARAEIAELRANAAKPQDVAAAQNVAQLAARSAAAAVDTTADLDAAFKRLDDYVKLLPRGFDVDNDGGVHVLNYSGAVDRIIRPPIAGQDGASVIGAKVDSDAELIIELSDGKVLNAGKISRPRARRKKVNGHAAHV